MSINDYKTALKAIIDSTNDEELLRHWKNHLEWEFDQYQKQQVGQAQQPASAASSKREDKDDTSGYVVLESGLGIDE